MTACSVPHTVLGIFLKMSHLILTVTFRDVIIVSIYHLKDPKLRQVRHTQSQTAGKQQSWNYIQVCLSPQLWFSPLHQPQGERWHRDGHELDMGCSCPNQGTGVPWQTESSR